MDDPENGTAATAPDEDSPEAREARRKARASWPVRIYRDGTHPPADDVSHLSLEERFLAIWELSRLARELHGETRESTFRRDSVRVVRGRR